VPALVRTTLILTKTIFHCGSLNLTLSFPDFVETDSVTEVVETWWFAAVDGQ